MSTVLLRKWANAEKKITKGSSEVCQGRYQMVTNSSLSVPKVRFVERSEASGFSRWHHAEYADKEA